MKNVWFPLLLLLLQLAVPSAYAAFYQWTDAQGVVHLTDDFEKIPPLYQRRAKKLKLPDESAPQQRVAPGAQPPAQPAEPYLYGGHTEQWWRDSFQALRDELKALQRGISEKQARLLELRRLRTIYTRPSDREAANALEAEILADESRLGETQNKIEALDRQATRDAVPVEWRR